MRTLLTSTATALLLALPASTWAVQARAEVSPVPQAAASAPAAPAAPKAADSFAVLSAPSAQQEAASAARLAEPPPLPTPEPRTLAMMLAGLAALGLAASRRRG